MYKDVITDRDKISQLFVKRVVTISTEITGQFTILQNVHCHEKVGRVLGYFIWKIYMQIGAKNCINHICNGYFHISCQNINSKVSTCLKNIQYTSCKILYSYIQTNSEIINDKYCHVFHILQAYIFFRMANLTIDMIVDAHGVKKTF